MKKCKQCNRELPKDCQHWTYCNNKDCEKTRRQDYYMTHKSMHMKHEGSHHLHDNWACDCLGGLGYVIAVKFTKCMKCKKTQKQQITRPRYHKMFYPNIHARTMKSFYKEENGVVTPTHICN